MYSPTLIFILLVSTASSFPVDIQRRGIIQEVLSYAYTLAKGLMKDYQESEEIEKARFAMAVKVWYSANSDHHSVNLAPVVHVRNSQDKVRISTYRGMFSVGGVYHGSIDGLQSQITQIKLDFPNGDPSSVSAVCFSFGPDSVMSYQEPVCLPMSIMPYCKTIYNQSQAKPITKASLLSPRWVDFCDQKDCSRSLLIEDAAEFIYAFHAWERDDEDTAKRLCQSMQLTEPTFSTEKGHYKCYSFFEEKKVNRIQEKPIPSSSSFKSPFFTTESCPIGKFKFTAWEQTLLSPDATAEHTSLSSSSKW